MNNFMLDLVQAEVCSSNFQWEIKIGNHVVKWDRAPANFPYEYYWHCSCPGFQYHGKCKHIKEAKAKVCHWGQEAWSGTFLQPDIPGVCPKCGGTTTTIAVGV